MPIGAAGLVPPLPVPSRFRQSVSVDLSTSFLRQVQQPGEAAYLLYSPALLGYLPT